MVGDGVGGGGGDIGGVTKISLLENRLDEKNDNALYSLTYDMRSKVNMLIM